jgi:subtilisin-like proprotein convertase family protein
MKIKIVYLLLFVFSLHSFAQTKEQANKITSQYDLIKLNELSNKFSKTARIQKEEAIRKAKKEGWVIKGEENGNVFELMRLTPDGKPVYYETKNYYAAKTVRTDRLYNGGSLGINIQGQNMVVGLWDGGAVRGTHNLLNGRVIQKDGITFTSPNDYNRHATHVTGTMIANGLVRYRGMAFEATAWAHDWYDDDAEMAARAAEGLLISNHSYGMRAFNMFGIRQIDLYWFGKYSTDARNWDEIMYNAPYYLVVDAAGNDRQWSSNGPNKGGYDMLTGNSMSKNGICTAAVRRVTNYTGASSVQMSSFSNWGPTDDGRIKPDISAQGVDVSSCTSDSDSSTASYDGTSMAAPGVTGSLILLQQYYNETYGNFIKSATLKGLALHTADEAGNNTGPDYAFGWGLLNTAAAAQTIMNNGLKSVIKEITLHQGEVYSFDVNADGSMPLMASICWTDPAGRVISGTAADMLDNPTPALVNDLDIRIIKNGNTTYPWKLDPANPSAPATKGDNLVDNFEKVQLDNPSGTYTIQISHKGNLKYGEQDVSIIVTGISNPFAINTTDGEKRAVCSDSQSSTTFNLLYTQSSSVSGNTNFSINGLPSGANATFTPASMNNNGNFSLEITGLNNVAAGKYNLEVIGTNGNQTMIKNLQLHVLKDNFTSINLLSPGNGEGNLKKPFSLEWESNPNAEEYVLQISPYSNFSNIILEDTLSSTSYLIKEGTYGISNGYTYYWRIKPINRCSQGNFSQSYNFTTLQVNCNSDYNQTSVNIPTSANSSPIESIISFPQSLTIDRMKVYVDITHSKVSDLEIKIVGPNNNEVILNQSGTCNGTYADMQVTYNDLSNDFVECKSSSPAIRGEIKPFESLSAFYGLDTQGDWKLSISDPVANNGGSLNLWAIEFCEEVLDINKEEFSHFKVWPNPSNGQINIELTGEEIITVRLLDTMGREVYNKQFNNDNKLLKKHLILGDLKSGVYLLQITDNKKITTKRIIIN